MTAPNPEEQTDARRRGSAALGATQRARTAAPAQRIFVSGDRVVQQPPVLFSLPAVKAAEVETRRVDAGELPVREEAKTSGASGSKPAVSNQSGSSKDPSSGHSHGVRAPHFLNASQQAAKKTGQSNADSIAKQYASETETAESSPASGPLRIDEPTSGRSRAASVETAESELERLNQYQRVHETNRTQDEERSSDFDRGTSRTPKAQRSLPPVPEPVGVPSGRSWMEVIGSRAVIVLLVLAIGAIAILANRDSKPRSAAELAILELDGSEDAGSATAEAAISRTESSADPARSIKQTETGLERVSALNGPARPLRTDADPVSSLTTTGSTAAGNTTNGNASASDSTFGKTGEVKAVEAEFDLAELMDGNVESKPAPATPSTRSDILNPPSLSAPEVAGNSQITQPNSAATTVSQPPVPAAGNPAMNDWQRDLQQLGSEVGVQQSPTLSESRATTSAPLSNAAAGNRSTAGGDSLSNNRWVREPGAQDSDAAISAAIDAARLNRPATDATAPAAPSFNAQLNNTTSNNTTSDNAAADEAVITTAQPAGIPDWSRYLPTNSQPTNPYPANSGFPQNSYPQNFYPQTQGTGGYQPNLMPPGTINPPNAPTQNYPAQSFSAGQPYSPNQGGFVMPYGGAAQPASSPQGGAPQFNSTQLNSTQLNSTQLNSTQFNSSQFNAPQQYNAPQYGPNPLNGMQYPNYQTNPQPTAPTNQATSPTGFSGSNR